MNDKTGEPVTAWLHELTEPNGNRLNTLSFSEDFPWSHWIQGHLEKCVYTRAQLVDAPAVAVKDDTSHLSEAKLDEIEALAKKATPGPWTLEDNEIIPPGVVKADERRANTALVMALRNAADALISMARSRPVKDDTSQRVTEQAVEAALKAFEPELFGDDPVAAHMAASPLKVEFAQARGREKIRGAIAAAIAAALPYLSRPVEPDPVERGEAVAYVSAGQFEALPPDPHGNGGATYLPIRHTPAGNFQMPLYAHPAPAVEGRDGVPIRVPALSAGSEVKTPGHREKGRVTFIYVEHGNAHVAYPIGSELCDLADILPWHSHRDNLGRAVRQAWVKWAKTQPDPKPSWLVPYDELSEPDKEADRQIGEALSLYEVP